MKVLIPELLGALYDLSAQYRKNTSFLILYYFHSMRFDWLLQTFIRGFRKRLRSLSYSWQLLIS